jgi:hypothetical protein
MRQQNRAAVYLLSVLGLVLLNLKIEVNSNVENKRQTYFIKIATSSIVISLFSYLLKRQMTCPSQIQTLLMCASNNERIILYSFSVSL